MATITTKVKITMAKKAMEIHIRKQFIFKYISIYDFLK